MSAGLVGRDTVAEHASAVLRGHGRVLLEGPAGIGKTAVLRALVRQAAEAGMAVAACAPAEAEAGLPLAALTDLLRPLATGLDGLPAPQRDAVSAAVEGTGEEVHERALAAGTLSLLEVAARASPGGLLVAVDDAPWLDPPSERALRFALRRLTGPVAVLVSRRRSDAEDAVVRVTEGHDTAEVPLGLDDPVRIALEPLGAGPLYHLLTAHFGTTLTRPLVARLARDSGGNPLLAIELTRAVLRLPRRPGSGEDLPVPGSMRELVAGSLADLPAPALAAVRYAALLAAPDLGALRAVGVAASDLDAAEEAGLVRVDTLDRIRFTHPVYATAVRATIPPGVRRRLQLELARVVADPDERARQLGAATTAPDADVSAELAAAARRARARGAPDLAVTLHDQAAGLAADSDTRAEQQLAAVLARYETGDYAAAGAHAAVLADQVTGDRRAAALLLRATVAFSADDTAAAVEHAEAALAAARPGTRLAGRIHAHLAVFVDLPGPARAHAEAALRLLPDDPGHTDDTGALDLPGAEDADPAGSLLTGDDRSLLASALMLLFLNEVRSGLPPRHELLDRALALENGVPTWLAGTIPAIWWKGVDEHARAVERLEVMLDLAVASGEEPWQHELAAHLGEAQTLAGDFPQAARWIARARDLGEQLDTGLASEIWLEGMLDVHRGAVDRAAGAAAEGLRGAGRSGEPWARRVFLHLAAFAALAAGDHAAAAGRYRELADLIDASGLLEPLSTRFEGDWVEAAVNAGDLVAADTAAARLAARHERLPRPWTSLALARARVLLAAARGEDTAAPVDALLAARDAVPAGVVPFERARCLLVAGLVHRRARRRSAARAALVAAADEFATLGAAGFARRARDEAARTGTRAAASSELTSSELRVAELAAAGRTNRMIADSLFISPKTVEANLARIYRKLGISSRAELGAAVAARSAGLQT